MATHSVRRMFLNLLPPMIGIIIGVASCAVWDMLKSPTHRYDLATVSKTLGAEAEKLSIPEFLEHSSLLREYYAGDPFALASLAHAESQVQRHRRNSQVEESRLLEEAALYARRARQELLLLEMEISRDRGASAGRSGNHTGEVSFLKDAIGHYDDVVPPLYVGSEDDLWRSRAKELYSEICLNLLAVSTDEELSSVYVAPFIAIGLAQTLPDKLSKVRVMIPLSGKRNRIAIKWMEVLIKDGEFGGGDRECVEKSIGLLKKWENSQFRTGI